MKLDEEKQKRKMAVNKVIIPSGNELRELSEREQAILRTIIHLYLLNATPVGSRNLAKYLHEELKLSPASIRNVMADLEDLELITHPHTSAGRVPTDKGYRIYVDSLMNIEQLTNDELLAIEQKLSSTSQESVLKEASRILGMLSRYLGIVEIPHISDLKVHKIELIPLSSSRLLVVLDMDSNIVKTVTIEAEFEIDMIYLREISSFINERISGQNLSFIKENFTEIINEFDSGEKPLVRLFIDSVEKVFNIDRTSERIHIAGTQNLLKYPEFEDLERVKGVVELIENEDIIIHLLDKWDNSRDGLRVLIGREMQNELLEDYSLVISNYELGSATGSIGLIGPKRMNYSKMVSLVQYISGILSRVST